MHHALDLHDACAVRLGGSLRERQNLECVMTPDAISRRAFAAFIPVLNKVVMHIRCRRAGHLDVDIVALSPAEVAS